MRMHIFLHGAPEWTSLRFETQQIAARLEASIQYAMICEVLRDASMGTHLECVESWPAVLDAATLGERHRWVSEAARIRWDVIGRQKYQAARARRAARMGLTCRETKNSALCCHYNTHYNTS